MARRHVVWSFVSRSSESAKESKAVTDDSLALTAVHVDEYKDPDARPAFGEGK